MSMRVGSTSKRAFAHVLALALTVGMLSVSAPQPQVEALEAGFGQLRFCRDANGDRLAGDIDILLLLDDTLTLRTQDRNQARFGVIRNFLEGVTSIESSQTVNFATYVFGSNATPVLDFAPITTDDLDRIDGVIRANNSAQQNTTNFIRAITRASQTLNARPAQNCRILLWFTDGNHDANDDFSAAADRQESDELRQAFCSPDGLADRVRSQRINTFVLLLDPPPLQPLRLEASKDIFQVLTGDSRPGFPNETRPDRTPTDVCGGTLGEQLGKVFAVAQSEQLVAIIADFLNELEDGGIITAESCPYPDGTLDSLQMPDAHLVDWISATDFSTGSGGNPPALSRLTIVTAAGEELVAGDVMDQIWTSGPSARFRVRESQRDLLGPGWVVRAPEARDLCLRSRAVDLTFRLSTGEPSVAVVSPRGLPERLWGEGQLGYTTRNGRVISLEEALRSPEVRGRLAVEFGTTFSPDATLPARIVVDGAPLRGEQCSVIEIPLSASLSAGGALLRGVQEAPRVPLQGSECIITPATRGDDGGTLDFTATLGGLVALKGDERCDVGDDWHVLIDGRRIDGAVQTIAAGGAPVRFALASGAEPPNEKRECIGRTLPPVLLEWQGQTVAIPVTVTAEWERRGDLGIASGFTAIALLLAIVASYGLLWLLNWLLLRPPAGPTLKGFDVAAVLSVNQRGDVSVDWSEGRPQSFTGILMTGSGGGTSPLRIGKNSFTRILPFNPLKEPTLRMERSDAAVTATSFPRVGSGIPIDFPELALLSTRSTVPATADRPIDVTFTVIVPTALTASSEQSFSRLEGRKSEMARRLQQVLLSRQASDGTAKREKAGSRGPSRDEKVEATARPRPSATARKDGQSARQRPGADGRPRPQQSGDARTPGIDSSRGNSGFSPGSGRMPPDDRGEGNASGGRQPRPRPK